MKPSFYYIKAALIVQFFLVALFAFPLFVNAPSTFLVFVGLVLLVVSFVIAMRSVVVLLKSRQTGSEAARNVKQYIANRYWTIKDLDVIQKQLDIERKTATKDI